MRRLLLALPLLLAAGCGAATTAAPSSSGPAAASSSVGALVPSRTLHTGYADVPTYHQDAQRTGASADTPAPKQPGVAWAHDLDGAVYAQPLVVGGLVVVATENDTVYAFDATTGAQRWMHHLGTAQPAASLPCGDIDPEAGITGTPVYDPATRTVFLVADLSGPHHELFGLDPTTGATRFGVGADVPGSDPRTEQQRGALALAKGQVYVTYGALAGDCGSYHGEVVTATTAGRIVATLALPTENGGGIWAPSGPTVSATGEVYVTSANSEVRSGAAYDDSNGTLRLSPTLQVLDRFAAGDYASKDAEDLGQGSTGPTLLADGLVVTVGKDLPNYVLDAAHLGGVGGQLATTALCAGYGGTAHAGEVVYIPCTDGVTAARVARTGLTRLWTASAVIGAPVVGGGVVFSLDADAGVLQLLSAATGRALDAVTLPAATTRFATPALWGPYAFVGTTKGIVAVGGV